MYQVLLFKFGCHLCKGSIGKQECCLMREDVDISLKHSVENPMVKRTQINNLE